MQTIATILTNQQIILMHDKSSLTIQIGNTRNLVIVIQTISFFSDI